LTWIYIFTHLYIFTHVTCINMSCRCWSVLLLQAWDVCLHISYDIAHKRNTFILDLNIHIYTGIHLTRIYIFTQVYISTHVTCVCIRHAGVDQFCCWGPARRCLSAHVAAYDQSHLRLSQSWRWGVVVGHDSFIYGTWLIDMSDMTHWYVGHEYHMLWERTVVYGCHDSFVCGHDSFIGVPWLIHMCVMMHAYDCHDLSKCVPWLIWMCAMTHSDVYMCATTHPNVCHDSSKCVPWLIQTCAMTHSNVCHDSSKCSCLIQMCAMTPWDVCHDSSKYLIHTCAISHSYVYMCAMTHPNVCHDSFKRVPWLIQRCAMSHLYVCHDSFKFVTWPIYTWVANHWFVCHLSFFLSFHDSGWASPQFWIAYFMRDADFLSCRENYGCRSAACTHTDYTHSCPTYIAHTKHCTHVTHVTRMTYITTRIPHSSQITHTHTSHTHTHRTYIAHTKHFTHGTHLSYSTHITHMSQITHITHMSQITHTHILHTHTHDIHYIHAHITHPHTQHTLHTCNRRHTVHTLSIHTWHTLHAFTRESDYTRQYVCVCRYVCERGCICVCVQSMYFIDVNLYIYEKWSHACTHDIGYTHFETSVRLHALIYTDTRACTYLLWGGFG